MSEGASLEDLVAQEGAAETTTETTPETPQTEEGITGEAQTADAESADAEPETEPEGEAAEGETTEPEPSSLGQRLKELTGHDWTGKYKTDEDVGQAIKHLVQNLGQRDDDALLARDLKKRFGEDRIQALLEAQKTEPAPEPEPEENVLSTYGDYQRAVDAVQEGSGLSTDAKARAMKVLDAFARRNFDLVANADKMGESEAMKKLVERIDKIESNTTETGERQAIQSWAQEHHAKLFQKDDPQEKTPLGNKVEDLYEHDSVCQSLAPGSVHRWNAALRLAEAAQPKPKPTRKVPRQAQHQAGVGKAGDDLKTPAERVREMMEQGVNDQAVLESLALD